MNKKFNIKEWQEKHLLKEEPFENPVAGGGDYYHKSHHDGSGVDFDEFIININKGLGKKPTPLEEYLTQQIIDTYTDSDLNDLMYDMSMHFNLSADGSTI